MQKLAPLFALLCFPLALAGEPPPAGTAVQAGQGILLGKVRPQLKSLKKTDLTLEFWIRPDQATVARPRTLLWLFSNKRGSDVAGIGLSTSAGKLQANVLGSRLSSPAPMPADEWTHACLTIDTRRLNKVATLWINGRRIDRTLVPHRWPEGFFYTRLMTDPWGQNRLFSGQAGPVRISTEVLYQQAFTPESAWKPADSTLLLLQPDQIRLSR